MCSFLFAHKISSVLLKIEPRVKQDIMPECNNYRLIISPAFKGQMANAMYFVFWCECVSLWCSTVCRQITVRACVCDCSAFLCHMLICLPWYLEYKRADFYVVFRWVRRLKSDFNWFWSLELPALGQNDTTASSRRGKEKVRQGVKMQEYKRIGLSSHIIPQFSYCVLTFQPERLNLKTNILLLCWIGHIL